MLKRKGGMIVCMVKEMSKWVEMRVEINIWCALIRVCVCMYMCGFVCEEEKITFHAGKEK